MLEVTGLDSYNLVFAKNPVNEELRTISTQAPNLEHRKIAQGVKEAEADRDLAYSKCASLFREALIHLIKSFVRSEVFMYLMRSIVVMPNSFEQWTTNHFADSFRVNVNSLTPLQLCTEAYTTKPKAPFSLAKVHVHTADGIQYVPLPVNSSIKRSMMAIAVARAAKLPGSERKSQFFKKIMEGLYTSLHGSI